MTRLLSPDWSDRPSGRLDAACLRQTNQLKATELLTPQRSGFVCNVSQVEGTEGGAAPWQQSLPSPPHAHPSIVSGSSRLSSAVAPTALRLRSSCISVKNTAADDQHGDAAVSWVTS